jgi:hypothetical protein
VTVPTKRGRGRPPKPPKPFFEDGSPHTPSERASGLPGWPEQFIAGQRDMEALLRQDYGVGPHVSLDCVWPLLSVGEHEGELDGTLTDGDRRAIETFDRNTERQQQLANHAAAAKTALARARRDRLCLKNKDLLDQVKRGSRSRNSAVGVIRSRWLKRGDCGPMPCARTLNGWLKDFAGPLGAIIQHE